MSANSNKPNFAKQNGLNNQAVIIGINDYSKSKDKFKRLNNAAKDAVDLATVLHKSYDYTVHLFTDSQQVEPFSGLVKQPTLSEIKTFLEQEIPKIVEADKDKGLKTCLLFYFAGHGEAEKIDDRDARPKGFLIPQDAQDHNRETWLEMEKVYDYLTKSNCHHVLAILDSCYSGAFLWATEGRKGTVVRSKFYKEHLQRFKNQKTQLLMYSAAYNQEASDGHRGASKESGNSPFAAALIDVLKNNVNAPDKSRFAVKGIITASQLFAKIQEELSEAYQQPGVYPLKKEFVGREYIFYNPEFDETNLEKAPPINEQNNPYRGLQAYEERHAAVFRGRNVLIEELKQRLYLPVTTNLQELKSTVLESQASAVSEFEKLVTPESQESAKSLPLTIVLGNSGSEKSSLVKAGLLPLLRRCKETDDSKNADDREWQILDPIRPGATPFMPLARAVLPIAQPALLNHKGLQDLNQYFERLLKTENQLSLVKSEFAQSWKDCSPEARLLIVRDYYNHENNCFNIQGTENLELQIEQSDLLDVKNFYLQVEGTLDDLAQRLEEDSKNDEPAELTKIIKCWYDRQKSNQSRLLLIVDQLEELITFDRPDRAKAKSTEDKPETSVSDRFLNTILVALKAQSGSFQVIMTLRSDFEPQFLTTPLKDWWQYSRFPVRPMSSNELRQAIEEPAHAHALEFDPPEFVSQLIDELGQPGALPLLSFVLSELYVDLAKKWQGDESRRALVLEERNYPGGIAGFLSRRADAEYEALKKDYEEKGKDYQTMMRQVMLRMVTLDMGSAAKRQVPKSELDYLTEEKNKCCEEVINRLVKARLLVQGRDEGEPYYEPAHDYLIRGWASLQKWIKEKEEEFVLQKRLSVATNDWIERSYAEGYLWIEDPRIEQLEKIIANPENSWLNKRETEFVKACVQLRDRQARERLEKEVELNTTESQMHFTANDRLYAMRKLIETGKLLQKGLKITNYKKLDFLIKFNQFLSECAEINSIDIRDKVNKFSCNQTAQVIATVSGYNDKICFWDWQGNPINCEQNEERFYDLAFSPDGEILVTGGNDGLIKFYRREPNGWYAFHKNQGDPKKHDGIVHCIKFSPDGTFLVSVGLDRNIIFWERGGQYLANIAHEHNVDAVAFSPKDKRIAFVSRHKQTNKNTIVIKEYHFPDERTLQVESSHDIRLLNFDEFDAYHEGEIINIDFSPDGTTLVSVDKNGRLRIWSVDKSRNSREIGKQEDGSISAVAFSPDSKIVASSHTNGIINIWDALTEDIYGNVPHLYKLAGHKGNINRISFTFNGSQLLSCSDDGTVKFWSLRDRFEGYTTTEVQKVSFSKDNQIVSTVDTDGKLLFWRPTGELVKIPVK